MNKQCIKIVSLILGVSLMFAGNAFCLDHATAVGGEMQREIYLGMTKFELIYTIGAPDRIKSDGRSYHYDVFDLTAFLDQDMKINRIYMGKNFQGTVRKLDGNDVKLEDIFAEFGNPQSVDRRTYAPSTYLQTRATDEVEDAVDIPMEEGAPFPLEYRGQRKLYELYSRDMVMKYKYILDDDGISFYFDHHKNLYATVIYPARGERLGRLDAIQMIHFDFDRYNIKDRYVPILDHCVDYLNRYGKYYVVIEGHTDAKGTNAYNQRLSERRSNKVYNYFIKAGIPQSRLKMVGLSELEPIANNTTPDGHDDPGGRAINRRVQFQLRTKKFLPGDVPQAQNEQGP